MRWMCELCGHDLHVSGNACWPNPRCHRVYLRVSALEALGFEFDEEAAEWSRWHNELRSFQVHFCQVHSCHLLRELVTSRSGGSLQHALP